MASRLFILCLAAGLSHEVNISDDHILADRLAHIVHGEEGDGGSHEGFHLDPRLSSALYPEMGGQMGQTVGQEKKFPGDKMGQERLSTAVSMAALLFHQVTMSVREKDCVAKNVLKIHECIKEK